MLIPACLLPGCVTNPATGERYFDYYSQEEEVRIGQEAAQEAIPAYGGLIEDEVIQRYVSDIGQSIAAEVEPEYADLPWEFRALNDDGVNAFALPGGQIFVTRGLLRAANNEAQLAGVLAHEVAHVTAQHHDQAMQRRLALTGLSLAAMIAGAASEDERVQIGAAALVTGSGLISLSYDRGQENQSDELGLRYMTRAGYNPVGLAEMMGILSDMSQGNRPPEFLSTHPDPGNREERLMELIEQRYADAASSRSAIVGREAYQRNVLDRLR
jgi:predicted Zn-dependent protease